MSSTLEDCFYSTDPKIGSHVTAETASHSRLKNPRWPATVRKWADFDLPTLMTMDGGLLARTLAEQFDSNPCQTHGGHVRESFLDDTPKKEKTLDLHLSNSIQRTVNCALVHTQKWWKDQDRDILSHIPQPGVTMKCGAQAETIDSIETRSTYSPDWAGALPVLSSGSDERLPPLPKTILPGDTKLRWKVDLDLLNVATSAEPALAFSKLGLEANKQAPEDAGVSEPYVNKFHGLRYAIIQIYTYLYYAECRYGYIINESQLCVVRIRPSSDCDRPLSDRDKQTDLLRALKEDGLLEFATISYNVNDRSKISVSMALWWLHLLAAADHALDWRYRPLKDVTFRLGGGGPWNSRAPSEPYEAPPTSPIVEHQPIDRRRPALKRKRKSMDGSGREKKPKSSSTLSALTDRYVKDESEMDLDIRAFPTPEEKEGEYLGQSHSIAQNNPITPSLQRQQDQNWGPCGPFASNGPRYLDIRALPTPEERDGQYLDQSHLFAQNNPITPSLQRQQDQNWGPYGPFASNGPGYLETPPISEPWGNAIEEQLPYPDTPDAMITHNPHHQGYFLRRRRG